MRSASSASSGHTYSASKSLQMSNALRLRVLVQRAHAASSECVVALEAKSGDLARRQHDVEVPHDEVARDPVAIDVGQALHALVDSCRRRRRKINLVRQQKSPIASARMSYPRSSTHTSCRARLRDSGARKRTARPTSIPSSRSRTERSCEGTVESRLSAILGRHAVAVHVERSYQRQHFLCIACVDRTAR